MFGSSLKTFGTLSHTKLIIPRLIRPRRHISPHQVLNPSSCLSSRTSQAPFKMAASANTWADQSNKTRKLSFDNVFCAIADYVSNYTSPSEEAYRTAALALADALSCGILALNYTACTKLLGPAFPDVGSRHSTQTWDDQVPGCRVPGTPFILDPIQGAFNIGTMIRWLDYNDTFLAKEWGHPSDNIASLLAVMDYLDRRTRMDTQVGPGGKVASSGEGWNPPRASHTVGDLLLAMIKCYEIQGSLSLCNSLNRRGFDHVLFVKMASAALSCQLLGGSATDIAKVLSHVIVSGGPLRVYRQAPNTGSRKSWAAGLAASEAVQASVMVMKGEMGYPSALTDEAWGFEKVMLGGKAFTLPEEASLGCYVMENVLFKVSYPAEFHAQTAVEAAVKLHGQWQELLMKEREDTKSNCLSIPESFLQGIDKIHIVTHEAAVRIISKVGPLQNPADRDHCLQYMVAIALLTGDLKPTDYEEDRAQDPRIDLLRSKMVVEENSGFTTDYLDPAKRSISNSIQILFTDGSKSETQTVEYPVGHKRRREQSKPMLYDKCKQNLATKFSTVRVEEILRVFFGDIQTLKETRLTDLIELLQPES